MPRTWTPVKLVLRVFRPLSRVRRLALWMEVLFWRKWLRESDSVRVRTELLDPARPLSEDVLAVVDRLGADRVSILDVGAGPLTMVGYRHPSRDVGVDVTATDVLAPSYDRLLRRLGVQPVVPTIYADAERLTEQFAPRSFDVVVAANCIDHMQQPMRAIEQMVELTKAGGSVLLIHFADEGEKQAYTGLHTWNVHLENGRLMLTNERERIDVAERLGGAVEVHSRIENEIIRAELRRVT